VVAHSVELDLFVDPVILLGLRLPLEASNLGVQSSVLESRLYLKDRLLDVLAG
jgi:hypothetical protein